MKILIIRLSSIGDCVLSSPVLEALRDRYPDAHITWAVQAKSVSVVKGLPGLDEVLLWDTKSREKSLRRALQQTWREKFDIALDLHGLDKAALFAFASRAKRRVSGTSARFLANRTSNEHVDESEFLHAREFYLRRASFLDIAPDAVSRYYPRVPVQTEHREFAANFLLQMGVEREHHLVGLNLGASVMENRWPPQYLAELALRLVRSDPKIRVLVSGAPADAPLGAAFSSALDAMLGSENQDERARIMSSVGRLTLLQLAAVAEHFTAFVTADTGPMHIAAAMSAPVLALFGPANRFHTGPVHKPGTAPVRVIDGRDITGSWPAPMSAIKVDLVLEEVQKMVAEVAASGLRPIDAKVSSK